MRMTYRGGCPEKYLFIHHFDKAVDYSGRSSPHFPLTLPIGNDRVIERDVVPPRGEVSLCSYFGPNDISNGAGQEYRTPTASLGFIGRTLVISGVSDMAFLIISYSVSAAFFCPSDSG